MQPEPYPYCPHGSYVGGCGIDYMCHPCEMGDTTEEEYARHEEAIKEYHLEQQTQEGADKQFWNLPNHVLDGG